MHILKLKLAYAYGDQISDYDAVINRWLNNEYVVEWLKYESYRKLNEYWDILFASNESVFNSVLKYRRGCLEGLDPAKFILENVKTVDDLENVLRFTLYCYNDMILPRADLDTIQQEYMDYSKNKPTKGYLSEIFKLIDPGMKTFNIYSLEIMLKLCIVRKELAGVKELTNEDRDHIEYVLDGMREYTEAISGRTVVDIYFKEKDTIERNIFPETTGLSVKKRYLLYAMRHYDEFSKEMVSEFAKTTIEEFTEKEFIEFAQQTWSGYRLHTMELWYQALMFGNYIPKYVRQELGCFCNTDELLMTLEVNDLSDDGFFKDMVYYYMTTTCFWGDLNRRVSKYILKNGYLKTWYELLEGDDRWKNCHRMELVLLSEEVRELNLKSNELLNLSKMREDAQTLIERMRFKEGYRVVDNLQNIDYISFEGLQRLFKFYYELFQECNYPCSVSEKVEEIFKELKRRQDVNNAKAADIFFGKV